MPKAHVLVCAALLSTLSCSRAETSRQSSGPTSASAPTSTVASATAAAVAGPDSCDLSAMGLAKAQPLKTFDVPPGCTAPAEATSIRSEDAFHAAYQCSASSGIDFGKFELRVVRRPLCPACVGTKVVDDGKTLTFVSLQRQSCPNEPPPMPIEVALAFVLPAGAARGQAERSCTVPWSCR